MVRNHLKIAWRSLLKNKVYSVINIFGLTIGMACCLLIFQYVAYENGYDKVSKADRVVRLRLDSYQQGKLDWQSAAVYPAFGPAMKKDFPEVEGYCRLAKAELLLSNDERNIKFNENQGYYADASFLSMFDIRTIKGEPETALSGLDKVMLSADMAKKYFGNENPLGKTLSYRAPFANRSFEVTGVFDPLVHSHLTVNYLVSYPTIGSFRRERGDISMPEETSWGWYQFYTYLLLKPGTDRQALEAKLPDFCNRHINSLEWKKASNIRNEVHLMPLKDIHLHSHYLQEAESNGNSQTVSFLFLIGLFIVGIAWVNYINLSTAKSLERHVEVGVRKMIGATRRTLISQFAVESLLVNLIAFFSALLVAYLAAPWFGMLIGATAFPSFYLPKTYWYLISIVIFTGALLSSIYPAFILSGFKPMGVLKGVSKHHSTGWILRKGLIVIQFAISVVFVAGTIVVYQQVNYMRSQSLGVNIDHTLVLEGAGSLKASNYQNAFQPFKSDLLQLPGIKGMTVSTSVVGKENSWSNHINLLDDAASSPVAIDYLGVDYDYIPFYEMKMLAGRNFSRDFVSDSGATIVNETAARMLGFDSPKAAINHRISAENGTTIIGVVQDYHTESLHKEIEPQLMILRLNARNVYSVKIGSAPISSTLAAMQTVWDEHFPDDPFNYYFLSDAFDSQYRSDSRFGTIFGIFTSIAIIIACMGLLGLSVYNVLHRTKEIGIRKVLGASVPSIMALLSKDFVQLVLIAAALAMPIAWWIMDYWLQDFAYRIELRWWLFSLAGLLAVAITLLTIGIQSMKAALMNPVKSLRSE